ncbi:MAG TPA: right-handed parallel beta-helix repeat-containing protein, partial [Pirellulaceae bacterium]
GSTIEGNMAGLNTTQTFLAIGGGMRVFGTAHISDSFLRNNKSITNGVDELGYGGAVGVTEGGTLTIENTEISGNESDRGGGVAARGAKVEIRDSVISGNSSISNGGGLRFMRLGSNAGDVLVENTTFFDNYADGGGGIGLSTYANSSANTATLSVTGSTFEANASKFDGGGLEQFGGIVTIENSTFSKNTAINQGGAIWSSFSDDAKGSVAVRFSTITQNKSDAIGGGIFTEHEPFEIRNSILSGNVSVAGGGNDMYDYQTAGGGAPVDAQFTLVGDSGGHTVTDGVTGNLVGTPANLGALGNNGGTTRTHMLLAGPGQDDADPAATLTTDQRGFLRPGGNAMRDMGAVESDGTSPTLNLDFNNDSLYNCGDMDLLEAAIDAGAPVATFDVDGNAALSKNDVFAWLMEAGELRFGAGRFFKQGDANLDGLADGSDFGLWNANKFTTARRWCTGDFNQDNVTDGSDFGIWNANKFTSSDAGSRGGRSVTLGLGANHQASRGSAAGKVLDQAIPAAESVVDVARTGAPRVSSTVAAESIRARTTGIEPIVHRAELSVSPGRSEAGIATQQRAIDRYFQVDTQQGRRANDSLRGRPRSLATSIFADGAAKSTLGS